MQQSVILYFRTYFIKYTEYKEKSEEKKRSSNNENCKGEFNQH